MPSPACEIKEGAGAYQSTDGGFDATPAATVTIHLIDTSARTWTIECISTDETSVAATVTAGLTLDTPAKTASFTAPAAGKAYRFRSTVNGGVDARGVAQASYSTTFCVYTLTGSARVIAVDETTEGDSTFGWIASLNAVLRSAGGALPGGSDPELQFNNGGAFDGAANLAYSGGFLTLSSALKFSSSIGTAAQIVFSGSNATAQNLDVRAQNGSGAASNGGSLLLSAGAPGSSGSNGSIRFCVNGSTAILHTVDIAGACTSNAVAAVTSMGYGFADLSTNSATGAAMTLSAQNATGTTSTGGALNLASGTGTTTAGTVNIKTGSTTQIAVSPTLVTVTPTSRAETGNTRAKVYRDIANVQTTNATPATLFSWTIPDEATSLITIDVCAVQSTGGTTATYNGKIRFKRDGGTVSAGTYTEIYRDEEIGFASCDVVIDNSTSTGRVRVTGIAATTIDWGGVIERLEVTHA